MTVPMLVVQGRPRPVRHAPVVAPARGRRRGRRSRAQGGYRRHRARRCDRGSPGSSARRPARRARACAVLRSQSRPGGRSRRAGSRLGLEPSSGAASSSSVPCMEVQEVGFDSAARGPPRTATRPRGGSRRRAAGGVRAVSSSRRASHASRRSALGGGTLLFVPSGSAHPGTQPESSSAYGSQRSRSRLLDGLRAPAGRLEVALGVVMGAAEPPRVRPDPASRGRRR